MLNVIKVLIALILFICIITNNIINNDIVKHCSQILIADIVTSIIIYSIDKHIESIGE